MIAARKRWAYSLIRKATAPAAPYGSVEWLSYPSGDPRKVSACIQAAECWAQSWDTLVDDLTRELDDARHAHKTADDADYAARAKAHHQRWNGVDKGRSFTERRREQLDAARPRPGDYPGRTRAKLRETSSYDETTNGDAS